jgi:predicted flap endonuclease-1-like 5' DNA nuclease
MFDGTGWAAAEIVVFMLIATLIGLAIGWILGRWVQRSNVGGDYQAEVEAAREQAAAADGRLADLQAELDRSQLEVRTEQAKLAEISGQLEQAEAISADLDAARTELAEKNSEIERLVGELESKSGLEADLESKSGVLAEREAEIERLVGELESKSGLEADLESKSGVLAEREAEVERLVGELESCHGERTAREEELGRVRADLDAAAARVEALEADLTTTTAAAPAAVVEDVAAEEAVPEVGLPDQPVAAGDEVEPSKEEGLARIAEIAERTAGSGPRADDDLKKVHGIGPKLERTLKGLGITSFRQIANFQPDDIAFVTAALDAFKGRIERDDWMSSAAEEHAKKYGELA